MGKRIRHIRKQSSGAAAWYAAGLLGVSLLCLPLASAASRVGVDGQDGIVAAGVGMQDLTPIAWRMANGVTPMASPVPVQDAPIALIQAAAGAAAMPADYQLTVCQETESTGDSRSGFRVVDPAQMLTNYLQDRGHRAFTLEEMAAVKLSVLTGPAHGSLVSGVAEGRTFYRYDVEPNYIGADKAVFMAEYGGKRYKIVVDFRVSLMVDEKEPVCPPPQLIKVNGKPTSGSSAYQLNSYTITFGDLPGSSVGQASGNEIALDLTAAGHGWYIDPTPLDNSDDYRPTSNPNVWQAKAGSDAAEDWGSQKIGQEDWCKKIGVMHKKTRRLGSGPALRQGEARRVRAAAEMLDCRT